MYKIEIYTKNVCGFCDRAKQIFYSKKLSFKEFNISHNQEYLKNMLQKSNGYMTMPQIFINENHIGGYDQLKELLDNGELDKLINSK